MPDMDVLIEAQDRLLAHCGVDATSEWIDVPSVRGRVHLLRCGTGPPVILVPGFADPAAMWASLLSRLDGYTLVAVDRPGFGLTGPAAVSTGSVRERAVRFLDEVLAALEIERATFVGNSIGSAWTTWLALDHPGRVSALVHVGCPAFWLGTSAPLPLRLVTVPLLGRLLMAAPPGKRQVEAFARNIAGEDLTRHPELRDLLLAAQRLPGARESTRDLLRSVVRLRGARGEVQMSSAELRRILQPVQLIWGDRDAFGDRGVAEAAARVIPGAEVEIVPGAGHVPWVGHPDEVARAVLRFLSGHRHR